jgi:prohibitin 2
MFWLIATILLAIVAGIALIVAFSAQPLPDHVQDRLGARLGGFLTAAVCLVIWVVLSVFVSIHTVGQRQEGIVYNFSGTITGTTGNGVVMTWPWQHIQIANIGILREPFSLDSTNSAVSSDQQAVYADLVLYYQVEPSHILGLYQTVGPAWKQTLLDSRVLQDFKEVTAQYQASDITRSRPELRSKTRSLLEAELANYDIKVVDFFVTNLHFNDAYNNAITARNVQVQQALQAQAKVAQSRAEAEQAIAQARGQAEAIRLKGQALKQNPSVLTLEYIDKLAPNVKLIVPQGSTLVQGLGNLGVAGASSP